MKTLKRKHMRTVVAPVQGERRAVLNSIRARAKQFGFAPSSVREKTLVLWAKLENNKSGLQWDLNQETQTYDPEIRLEKSDAIYIDRWALSICKVNIVGGVEQFANVRHMHYPDANIHAATGEANDLLGLFNSEIEVKTDQDVRQERYYTGKFLKIPRQQFQPSATDPLVAQTVNQWVTINERIAFWGKKRNSIRLDYGSGSFAAIAGAPTAGTNPYQNYAVLFLDGFEIVRGSESLSLTDANMILYGG